MISQTVEYALRAMTVLARNASISLTGREISHAADIPPKYATKVLQSLAKGGLINAVRGTGGGYTLNMASDQISMLDIVNCINPIQRIKRCPLNRPEHRQQLCPLHRRLDQAIATTERAFQETCLTELTEAPADVLPPRIPLGVVGGARTLSTPARRQ